MDFLGVYSVSTSGLEAQGRRLRVIAENIANADTPGFRRKELTFAEAAGAGGVAVTGMQLDETTPLQTIYDPSHPMADDNGYYFGSNVSLVVEIADAREAQRSYEANLRLFDQARQMSSALLDLIKR